jgi:DNA polymerase-1
MALNAPFQGSAADVIKIAMIRLDRALADRKLASRMILQVHDELVLEAPDAEAGAVSELVREVMEGAADLKVRLSVEVGFGRDWLSAK